MDRYITMKDALTQEITLKNSKGQEVTLNLGKVILETNEQGIDHSYFPEELSFKGKIGDWIEVLVIPTANGKYNPETDEDEFCPPYWRTWGEGMYDADIKVDRLFWHDGAWQYPINYMPEDVKKEVNGNWEAFRVPLFS